MLLMKSIDIKSEDFEKYLFQTLGISLKLKLVSDNPALPFFLRDVYFFYTSSFLNASYVIMMKRTDDELTPATIQKHRQVIQEKLKKETIFFCSKLSSHNRKRLIEQKIPFVVPYNQMYLPMLGVALQEYFRIEQTLSIEFSPSTQTVLLFVLYSDIHAVYTPTFLAKKLEYSLMTLTRVMHELRNLDFCLIQKKGRELFIQFQADNKKDLWQKAKPFLVNPVKQRLWIEPLKKKLSLPQAGLSALAQYSQLEHHDPQVFAIGKDEWKTLSQQRIFKILPDSDPPACELEIWKYNPKVFALDGRVDPLSLFLSLQKNHDERVELALTELMGNLRW